MFSSTVIVINIIFATTTGATIIVTSRYHYYYYYYYYYYCYYYNQLSMYDCYCSYLCNHLLDCELPVEDVVLRHEAGHLRSRKSLLLIALAYITSLSMCIS